MFDDTCSTKEQGNVGLGAAIAYFTQKRATVLLPLNDSQDYDLVVDLDGFLEKVQVKTTRCRATSGKFVVNLRSMGGTKGTTYGSVSSSSADLLFVLTQTGDKYLIPRELFKDSLSTLTLNDSLSGYLV